MLNSSQHLKFLRYLKVIISSSTTPKWYHLLQQQYSSPCSLRFSTSTSGKHSFTLCYLVNNCGLSPESALKASEDVCFQTPEKPDSVLSFFRNHGFSNPQIHNIIRTDPSLLVCYPDKRILPKFHFLLSKGASNSDIVHMVSKHPTILQRSLKNHIIPSYELLKGILHSDEQTIACTKRYATLLFHSRLRRNVDVMREGGVSDSNFARMLGKRASILCTNHLGMAVLELKQLGFDPSKPMFSLALMAKNGISKNLWDAKVDVYKKWGWSEEDLLKAFKSQPQCMLKSVDKIDAVMNFWVNHLGWDSLAIVKGPDIVGFSLEKRIIPRASVLQVLLSKGLMKKEASLTVPFRYSEKVFVEKFVKCFKEESPQLLKLYEEKMNLQNNTSEGSTDV